MHLVNIHEAKSTLSAIVEKVRRGEEIIIGKYNTPVAKIVPFDKISTKRIPGQYKGKITISDDFDDPSPEIEKLFGYE